METIHISSRERPHHEMQQRSSFVEAFFSPRHSKYRPVSVATEFMEDWDVEDLDDEEIISDGEDGESSPRVSLNSSGGQNSITTLSSYDEAHTPRSSKYRGAFPFDSDVKSVEGPRGPHLFRSSMSSAHSIEFQHALSLSPLTPKVANEQFHLPIAIDITPLPTRKPKDGAFRYSDEKLDTATLPEWSPEMVAQWMLDAGVEYSTCDRFVENDIQGAILITLKFEDLKELGISSFGVRTKVWDEIHHMRNIKTEEPVPDTDIEDAPDKEARKEMRRRESDKASRLRPARRLHKMDEVITPLESVSIVGIEHMMPRPHRCSKGENCPKWQRNKRMMDAFKKDHPFVDMDGGIIMVAGDPGNPETADAIRPAHDDGFRPVSDAIPSVVASSDVMGPGSMPTFQYLAEATLRNLQSRDPQDNVRQFLDFQRQHTPGSSEVPPTPPFEIFPARQAPHQGLQSLSKLSIPGRPPRPPQPSSLRETTFAVESSPEEEDEHHTDEGESTPTAVYRFGTPFSDMDVPVTAVPLGPVARDASQSVPPDMGYRHSPAPQQQPPRSMSRASGRRPSFPVMPALDENAIVDPTVRDSPPGRRTPPTRRSPAAAQRPLQPPPRVQYPWSPVNRAPFEKAIAPLPGSIGSNLSSGKPAAPVAVTAAVGKDASSSAGSTDPDAISYQGPMRKRKTKMLRHEWHEHYFTLRGTRLAMHKDVTATNRTLEYVDIDDYAIACGGLASGRKLNAAFRAVSHLRGGSKDDSSSSSSLASSGNVGAFSFQLIPQDQKGGAKLLRKAGNRDSGMPAAAGGGAKSAAEGVNGTGKTHHFAVRGRDERIDWMRELMLAKALRQKGEGFEVTVNGNMI